MEEKNTKMTFAQYVKRFFKNNLHYWWYYLIILFVIGFDQVSKRIVLAKMTLGQTVPIIPNIIHFTYTENKGMAFSLLSDRREIFIIASIIGIIIFLIYLFAKDEFKILFDLGLTFVIGGGIGNMIDRIGRGSVTDMIEFRFMKFAIFNVADSFVCIGAGFIILSILLDLIKESKQKKGDSK